MASKIRWKQGDFIRLGRAVAEFNKKINKLNAEENKLYLPDIIEYKEAKENITTRKELNRMINSLKRFQREGAEELYTTQAGEDITRWERRELGIQSRIAQTRLTRELKALNEPLESGFSRAQMGSARVREIEAQIRNLKQIETKTGYEFRALKRRIQRVGTSDYSMRKAITYQENYLKMLKESYSNFDNFDKLMAKLESIKNPQKFYEYLSQNELLADITYMYDLSGEGIAGVSDQNKFDFMLESLGIEI